MNVSWNDAVAFCEWLTRREKAVYRLPTEAEWEYACRAGTTTLFSSGNDPEGLLSVANVADGTLKQKFSGWTTIAGSDKFAFTAPVGSFHANGFGLFDMHGNVWEWCHDWYASGYYAKSRRKTIRPGRPAARCESSAAAVGTTRPLCAVRRFAIGTCPPTAIISSVSASSPCRPVASASVRAAIAASISTAAC